MIIAPEGYKAVVALKPSYGSERYEVLDEAAAKQLDGEGFGPIVRIFVPEEELK